MRRAAFALILVLRLGTAEADDILTPSDFSAGKGAWQGPAVPERADGDATPVLRVKLSRSRWSVLEVRFRSPAPAVTLTIEIRPSEPFRPETSSRTYAPDDFRPGGAYQASQRVFPKADLLVQLSDTRTWHYRPFRLQPGWQTLTTRLTDRTSGQPETLALCFPPGDGTVDVRRVRLTAP